MANTISYHFFNPIRNKKHNSQPSAHLSFKECWLEDFYILRGKTATPQNHENADWWVKLFNSDSYFPLLIGLCTFYKDKDPKLISLKSNLGVLHYFNPFAILSLVSVSTSIKLNDLAKDFKASNQSLSQMFETFSTINYFLFAIPLIIVGFVSQVLYTLVNAGLSALLASVSAGINELGKLTQANNDQADTSVEESLSLQA